MDQTLIKMGYLNRIINDSIVWARDSVSIEGLYAVLGVCVRVCVRGGG